MNAFTLEGNFSRNFHQVGWVNACTGTAFLPTRVDGRGEKEGRLTFDVHASMPSHGRSVIA